ncbi:MAG: WYL domain-containing protein [Comamonadaceae bacterium]|uniref:helix-turn-helix transcriptional regulator n=2 Tax=Candidatus Skiveiella danica TaxID=3386177 RepID=UPI003909ED76|nr:WYL domain-containing protein [Comamonadaceae bacterium]MBK6555760.1 WYL domain-containing protein [Comamonadaceae bacterium]
MAWLAAAWLLSRHPVDAPDRPPDCVDRPRYHPPMDRNFKRLLDTLQLIPTRGKIATSTLVQRLKDRRHDVSTRTVQRDLESLADSFDDLKCDRRNKPYGWYWANEARRITVPGMDASQALSLRLLQTYLVDLLPESTVRDLRPYFEEAANKLTQHYGDTAVQRWLDKVAIVPATQPLLPPPVKPSVHDIVTQALLSERQLDIRYTGPGGKGDKSATVHPLGLVQHGVVQYLVATFFDFEDPRLLPLQRIQAAKLLDKPSACPAGFTLKGYIEQGAFGFGHNNAKTQSIRLVAVFGPQSGAHLLESRLSADQAVQELPDGRLRFVATVAHTERLIWWLLSFGPYVLVEKPLALRREVAARLRDAAAQYAKAALADPV